MDINPKIAVVIPAYKVCQHIEKVISGIGPEVSRIYVVDDGCPDGSGKFLQAICTDPRVTIIRKPVNEGVGGAVMTGYEMALQDQADIIVKVDGDGQMDPSLIKDFVMPIAAGEADYTKGNRFYNLEKIRTMPKARLFGNAALSFMTKLSSGYWDLFDPTNGYTAIHSDIARKLPLKKISRRYFFETDMLFRLNTMRAVVIDIPIDAKYGDETSNLKISSIFCEFLLKHNRNFFKRIFYNYYLRDMSLASIELPLGIILSLFGMSFGIYHWIASRLVDESMTAETVMLSAMSLIIGIQFILAFIAYDISSIPKRVLHRNNH